MGEPPAVRAPTLEMPRCVVGVFEEDTLDGDNRVLYIHVADDTDAEAVLRTAYTSSSAARRLVTNGAVTDLKSLKPLRPRPPCAVSRVFGLTDEGPPFEVEGEVEDFPHNAFTDPDIDTAFLFDRETNAWTVFHNI